MTKIRGIIFDMDGVLIEAKDWHYEALNRALNHFGYTISRYDHLVAFDGLPTRHKLELLSKERGLPISLHSFLNELKQIYTLELVHARCKPIFQHEYALSNLKTMGYRLAVASNSIRNTIEIMMQKSNLISYFEFMLSNQDVILGKPNPEIYQKSIQKFGLMPQECLVIEDNENGIKAAQEANAHIFVVKSILEVNLDNILNYIQYLERDV